jgi:hypothetical protein
MHTPGPWIARVIPASCGLQRTGYAHQVVIGGSAHTVAHTSHQNYDHIHTEDIGNGCVRQTGIGPRKADMTPHPDARLISAAPEMLEALQAWENAAEHSQRYATIDPQGCSDAWQDAEKTRDAAIKKATGQ